MGYVKKHFQLELGLMSSSSNHTLQIWSFLPHYVDCFGHETPNPMCHVGWVTGLVADVDFESERYRWMGRLRLDIQVYISFVFPSLIAKLVRRNFVYLG